MNLLIPPFDFDRIFVVPWTTQASGFLWIALMGVLVNATCGLIGNYLILRRMALVGDAISHSVLPGLVVAFLISRTRSSISMFIGALVAGIVTTIIIEIIHKKSRVKQDSAIGIAFSTLFALGVVMISLFADKVDLDQDCVLYGEVGLVWMEPMVKWLGMSIAPVPIVRMGLIGLMTLLLIILFYKELLVSSFDSGLAASLGIRANVVHYALMSQLSLVIVSAFESAGAILVVAMLILPGATASLLSMRLPIILGLSVFIAAVSSLLGMHLAIWLDCSMAGAMVVMGMIFFCTAWIFSPQQGLIWRLFSSRAILPPPEEEEKTLVNPG